MGIAQSLRARRCGATGALADVPLALPALSRAAKLTRRAARVGFDWPDEAAVRPKIAEELRETEPAVAAGDPAAIEEELGDALFALVNWARQLGVDPEQALRLANHKFERRFAGMEQLLARAGWSPVRSPPQPGMSCGMRSNAAA